MKNWIKTEHKPGGKRVKSLAREPKMLSEMLKFHPY